MNALENHERLQNLRNQVISLENIKEWIQNHDKE